MLCSKWQTAPFLEQENINKYYLQKWENKHFMGMAANEAERKLNPFPASYDYCFSDAYSKI